MQFKLPIIGLSFLVLMTMCISHFWISSSITVLHRLSRGTNILDVVLVDNVHAVLNISNHPPFSFSDDDAVVFCTVR